MNPLITKEKQEVEMSQEKIHISEVTDYKNPFVIQTQVLGVAIEEEDNLKGLIDALMICESGGNWKAVNPKDLDGTPSWGLFQFKPTTWRHYVKKYELFEWRNFDDADWWNTMMNGDLQRIVVERMFTDPQVRLRTTEFPGCSKKLGLKQNYAK